MPILDNDSSHPPYADPIDPQHPEKSNDRESGKRFYGTDSEFATLSPSIPREQLILRIKEENQCNRRHADETQPRSDQFLFGHSPNSQLLPAFGHDWRPDDATDPEADPMTSHQAAGLEIQRPRSAFHAGDFRDRSEAPVESDTDRLDSHPVSHSHPTHHTPTKPVPIAYEKRPVRSRAVSNASTTSLLFMPPTSPLATQSMADEPSRRHTLSPFAFRGWSASSMMSRFDDIEPALHSAHQSYHSNIRISSIFPHPQTPRSRRRPSLSQESLPLHHAPLVGSYEESILRGRMSTTPSRPLNFVAQIGVLGRGECKPSLQCPPHVTIGFPAVFYSYNGGTKITDSQPSPYVGLIDLEGTASERSKRRRSPEMHRARKQARPVQQRRAPTENESGQSSQRDSYTRTRSRSGSPMPRATPIGRSHRDGDRKSHIKSPLGGYRIPPQGHLQIVIKNPHKTAVKLFRVPYDVSDMPVGMKTFVRQRSFVESTEVAESGISNTAPHAPANSESRPPLRYLVHLNICRTSPTRHWLYGGIRVVFANRVPDGKETLRCETQVPEPRWSAYRPGIQSNTSRPTNHDHCRVSEPLFGISPLGSKLRSHLVDSTQLDLVDGLSDSRQRVNPDQTRYWTAASIQSFERRGEMHGCMSAEDRAKTQAEVQAKFEETYARAEAKERMNSRHAGNYHLSDDEFLPRLHDFGVPDPR